MRLNFEISSSKRWMERLKISQGIWSISVDEWKDVYVIKEGYFPSKKDIST